jgi:ligand-binding sensor domain-containing protein
MKLLQRTYVFFLAAIIVGCLPEVEAPDPSAIVEWENFMPSDGLAGTQVNSITEDSYGNLWIATNNGVSKYDGLSFYNYNTSNRPLPSNFITSILEYEPGFMVVGTDAAMAIFDGINWQTIYFDQNNTPYDVLSMAVDADGYGWVATDLYGLLFTDGDNNWWQWWDDQCYYCNFVNTMTLASNGTLWLGTQDGLKAISPSGNETRYTIQNGLPDNYIQSIFEDSWGTLWVGTYDGLARLEGNRFVAVDLYNSAPQNWVYTIGQDSRKKLWFGAIGNGLIYFDGVVMRSDEASLSDNRISTISSYGSSDGTLWFGTFEGGLWKHKPKQ